MGINQGPITLEENTRRSGQVFMNGTQALVRLPMVQMRRDRAAGLNTAAFISGYRGSPLGGYDQQLFAARKHLEEHDIMFQPGVNEDLAATAVWGSQQLSLSPGAKHDGVVGIWYGKGPASTAAATCSATPIPRARRKTAACSASPAMTTAPSLHRPAPV